MAETKFSVMVSLFNWIQKSKSSSVKRSKFRKFLDTFCRPSNGDDYFSAIRLILPSLDRERGSYGLREHVLATSLIDALGMSREASDSQRLLNWRKGGPKSGAFAGNFSLVAAEVLQRRQGMASGGLTINKLNELLDRLASSENRAEKTLVLSELIRKTNAQEMKWIIMIILKDLKLGISEKSIFHEFHPDAEDLFNVTCDLKLVCEKLRDRNLRHKRQDIEVGKPVRPQLAMRVSNSAVAWKKLHGKEVVVECKFDGDRIQIHKNGAVINFFSRNFLDHPEYIHGMSDIINENILVDRCILDGEMLVWDKSANRFAEFGSNQEIAKAAKEGLDSDRQLCYVAFDILYVGDTSVIHQSLKERHQNLKKIVKPLAGRLEILVPNGGLNAHCPAGEPCWSRIAHNVDDVERFFKETIENRDEGIVLKDLGSKWEPSDRSGKWLKLKPDYIHAGSDLDVLIIGGYYGSGRRGGDIAQFLVGLAERPAPNTYPRRFVSFCRVGTGLSNEELDAVVTKLKPYFRKYESSKNAPPSFYQVTNNSKERPDVWVESPEKSIVLSITSDIRTIRSEVFAAPYSLRFPRIDRVRHDKAWHECLDVQSFVELVHSSNGTTQKWTDYAVEDNKPKRAKLSRGAKKNVSAVPSHFIKTDVSQVKGETSIFLNMVFYFVSVPSSHSLDSLHKMVVENGGAFSMNLNSSVTHCIASESKGIKFQAAKHQGDVIHCSWFTDCCSKKMLLPLQSKYYLFLSDITKKRLQEEIDEFFDSYYLDINTEDLKQILKDTSKIEYPNSIEYYKKKLCPKEEWTRFHGCCIHFHLPRQLLKNMNWKTPLELAMRRMKIEVSIGGGTVAETLRHATHLVVVSYPQLDVDFDTSLSSFMEAERALLCSKNLQIVKSEWLENCFEKRQKLPEESYSLKPLGFGQSLSELDDQHNVGREDYSSYSNMGKRDATPPSDKLEKWSNTYATADKPRLVNLPARSIKRKRGSSSGNNTRKEKAIVKQPRRTSAGIARIGNKPAKISENESDEGASLDEKNTSENSDMNCGIPETVKDKGKSGCNSPRRTRARIRNKPAKIDGNAFDLDDSSDRQTIRKNFEVSEAKLVPDIQMEATVEESEAPERGQPVEPSVAECSGSRTQCNNQVADTLDPVQAMLLNMLPILSTQKTDTPTAIVEEVKFRDADQTQDEEKLPLNVDTKPVTKRKVSYKDVANQLLKDW
ncbi:DNA ligase 4 [Primulina tabacum]|uniref:DNA ligase 4 n=1 Tax=Primulina tabacum TaxID=48773 RepID=UPI003F59D2A5